MPSLTICGTSVEDRSEPDFFFKVKQKHCIWEPQLCKEMWQPLKDEETHKKCYFFSGHHPVWCWVISGPALRLFKNFFKKLLARNWEGPSSYHPPHILLPTLFISEKAICLSEACYELNTSQRQKCILRELGMVSQTDTATCRVSGPLPSELFRAAMGKHCLPCPCIWQQREGATYTTKCSICHTYHASPSSYTYGSRYLCNRQYLWIHSICLCKRQMLHLWVLQSRPSQTKNITMHCWRQQERRKN